MTTNRDWLFSLPLEEQYAWMNAEHAESPTSATMQHIGQVIESTVKRGVYGDTEPQDADSRDKLEADIRDTVPEWHVDTIIGWLDRQAAITAEETSNAWEEYRDATQREIAELTAERERYREKFGKCLDYADAIHALMDDEGLA